MMMMMMITSPKGSMYKTTYQLQPQTHKLQQQKHRIIHRPRKIVSFYITPEGKENPPEYLNDYITNSEDDSDHALINFDYCYKATCNIPRTYREAIDSSDAHCWVEAMHEELESLKENNVFELTNLHEGKKDSR